MIDNLHLIKPLLIFESEDDFYKLEVLQRKKENDKVGSNSRIIKNYFIGSIEYLEQKYEEIKTLCNVFNARAYIRLNKRSYEKVAFKTMVNVANQMSNRDYKSVSRAYESACGQSSNQKEDKRWIIDLDVQDLELINKIKDTLYNLEPIGDKFKVIIPSKNGFHIISNPFNVQQFGMYNFPVEIHKDNPSNLFIP